ncbi:MAG: porin, partial [Gammaproteobacteria bacterium]
MNKKLLAIAIAAAIASPYAALADEGNVTLCGNANMAVEHTDNGVDNVTNVASNGSDLAISGWEPLGNGLKAVFVFKSHVGLDDGSLFNAGGKDGYVGLAGGFGTVALGFHGQPYKTSTGGLDIFNDTIADHSSIMNGNGRFDSGITNSAIWFLPNMGGFSGHLQYGADETAGTDADAWGAQFNYSNGPIYVTYAHAHDGGSAPGTKTASADKIGGSYTFGGATTAAAIWEQIDNGTDTASA